MDMKSLLWKHRSDIALVIGNGINLYGLAHQTNSWHDLLVKLAEKHLPAKLRSVPTGGALTEFYDVLELKSTLSTTGPTLQQEFCDLMASWRHYEHHQRIVEWAQKLGRPILTTNFEQILSDAGKCTLHRTKKDGFTDYYPWESYYGVRKIDNPTEGFGIWHVNGMQHYRRSVRLGLSHYMGSVKRARGWLHKGNERRLYSGKICVNGMELPRGSTSCSILHCSYLGWALRRMRFSFDGFLSSAPGTSRNSPIEEKMLGTCTLEN